VALEDLVADHALDAGAFNCHVPQFRFGEPIGIAPCWALGRSTSAGVPWTCTGDILTAVAMLVTKRLGGAAVYHEIEAIDYATDEVVIANSGEHDLAWLAPGERPRLRRNGWFCGKDPHCGVCAVFEPPAGPATLVGFTPHPDARGGFRLVAARGELTERRFPETGTVNGAFRFRDGPVEEAWARWASAGVNHHSSATPGDISDDVATVARHLGIEAVIV
jgi:L-arabinose isomerase